jgi:ApaG protein
VPVTSRELPGLTARLDRLCHHHGGLALPPDKPHAFVYYITIRNGSDHTVTFLGRKWVIEHADGSRQVIEGDKIVGETPRLAPGEEYSYHSHMVTGDYARATGSYHGVDESGRRVHVLLPTFEMVIPPDESD